MLYQESSVQTDAGRYSSTTSSCPESVAMLAYRSNAIVPPSQEELDGILSSAQSRNRREGLTGLLIYDQGCFYQWLEGPIDGLLRVWDSIQRDKRHKNIEVLREQHLPQRFFGSWDMRLARKSKGKIDSALAQIGTPQELLNRLHDHPVILGHDTWDRLFCEVVIPRLQASHSSNAVAPSVARPAVRPISSAIIPAWHANVDSASVLGGLLLAVDQGKTGRYIDALMDEGASIEALYGEVFEPAARWLGGLWDEDLCTDFSLTLGLGRLQVEARRLGATAEHRHHALGSGHAILIAPHPGEIHGLGATLSSEMFLREGWDVSCEFPRSDKGLRELLHERWYDVLDLSFSSALRRDNRLQAMGITIRAAQAASLNPALTVIVDGRTFFDRPLAGRDVGADAAYVTSNNAVATAQRLLDAVALRHLAAVAPSLSTSGSQATYELKSA